MRPDIKTKIFLDSGNPDETKQIIETMGFLDGQTTNPSLFAKNPQVQAQIADGKKFSKEEVFDAYRSVVTQLRGILTDGQSISVEVSGNCCSDADSMYEEASMMYEWIHDAHVKLPTTQMGLTVAERMANEGKRLNMTLVFSQQQAAAVYAATRAAQRGDIFLSPFEGRLHDAEQDGMDVITNIMRMYKQGDGHVQVLAASIRDYNHFLYSLYAGVDIVTVPFDILHEWAGVGLPVPGKDINEEEFANENSYLHEQGVADMPYEEIALDREWQSYDISHELTDNGLEKFRTDWEKLIAS